jgi:hypothetical protein
MGTVKSYSLFTINQDNKAEEIHDCGKYTINTTDFANIVKFSASEYSLIRNYELVESSNLRIIRAL